MKMSVGCDLAYEVMDTTTFIFNVAVAQVPQHADLRETWSFAPDLPAEAITTDFNNRYTRLVVPRGAFRLRYEASVDLRFIMDDPLDVPETPIEHLSMDVFPYLLPSRFCQSDLLSETAEREFSALPKGHARVTAICNWIYERIEYRRGSSDSATSAMDTLDHRAGVCRDFAHLGIALCRALNIPARLVSGYAAGLVPADFHAIFEAYLDGRWWLFDPTRQAKLDGIVRIGTGRDAAEVSFASIYGDAQPTDMSVWAMQDDMSTLDERPVAAIG